MLKKIAPLATIVILLTNHVTMFAMDSDDILNNLSPITSDRTPSYRSESTPPMTPANQGTELGSIFDLFTPETPNSEYDTDEESPETPNQSPQKNRREYLTPQPKRNNVSNTRTHNSAPPRMTIRTVTNFTDGTRYNGLARNLFEEILEEDMDYRETAGMTSRDTFNSSLGNSILDTSVSSLGLVDESLLELVDENSLKYHEQIAKENGANFTLDRMFDKENNSKVVENTINTIWNTLEIDLEKILDDFEPTDSPSLNRENLYKNFCEAIEISSKKNISQLSNHGKNILVLIFNAALHITYDGLYEMDQLYEGGEIEEIDDEDIKKIQKIAITYSNFADALFLFAQALIEKTNIPLCVKSLSTPQEMPIHTLVRNLKIFLRRIATTQEYIIPHDISLITMLQGTKEVIKKMKNKKKDIIHIKNYANEMPIDLLTKKEGYGDEHLDTYVSALEKQVYHFKAIKSSSNELLELLKQE